MSLFGDQRVWSTRSSVVHLTLRRLGPSASTPHRPDVLDVTVAAPVRPGTPSVYRPFVVLDGSVHLCSRTPCSRQHPDGELSTRRTMCPDAPRAPGVTTAW